MGQLKLYKKFYQISFTRTANSIIGPNYFPLNPASLSANTYVASTGDTESSTLIESALNITNESANIYFADLDSTMYATDVTYDLVWFVEYIAGAPIKKISTRFRLNSNSVSNQIEIEIIHSPLEIEFTNNSLEIDIS